MTLVLLLLVILLAQYPRVIVSGDSYKEDEVVVTSVYKPSNCEIKVSTGETVNVRYKAFIHETSVSGVANSIVDQSKGVFKYKLGSSGMIAGWNIAIDGMCVGEKRQAIIPPSFAYGNKGSGKKIPSNATLLFEIELISIFRRPTNALFKEMDQDNDKFISYDEFIQWHENKNQQIPPMVFEKQDKNYDLKISWEEFSGPKGHSPDDL